MLSERGFTIIELMIAITIVGILLAFGLPSYSTWMNNMRIRGAAEAVQNGLQLARATAISRNTQAYFVFPTDGSLTSIVYSAVSPTNLPPNPRAPAPALIKTLQQYDQADAASNAAVATGGAYLVTFGSLGQVLVNPDGSASLSRIDVSSTAIDPAVRNLRVLLFPGGSTKMCDPAVVAPTDLRFCAF